MPGMKILFFVVFIDLFGFGIIIPILPYYAEAFGASGWELGLLMMSYSAMQFLFAPFWGKLSDRIGRKPVLAISLSVQALAFLVLGFANHLAWLFVGRIAAGIGGANIATAYAYVGDVTTEENRSKGMGLLGAAFGLGFTLGPAVGALLSDYGLSTPMFFAAGLGATNLVFLLLKLQESKNTSAEEEKPKESKSRLSLLSNKKLFLPIFLFFLFTFAVTQLEVMFAFFMAERFGFSAKEMGYLMASIGLAMVLVQGGAVGRLTQRFGERGLALFAFLISSVSMFLYAFSHQLVLSCSMLLILAIGRGLIQPSLSSITSKAAHPSERGQAMGLFHSGSSLARVLGPIAAGALYDFVHHEAPFQASGFVLFLALFLILFNREKLGPPMPRP